MEDVLAKEPNDKDFETGEDLYNAFDRFCKHHKLHILGSDAFSEILGKDYKHILKKDRKTIDKKRITIWKGCKLVKWKNVDDSSQTTLAAADEDSVDETTEESTKIEQQETPEEKSQREQEEMKNGETG